MIETAHATATGRSPASSTAVRIMLSAMPVCTSTWPNQAPKTMITMVLAYCSPPFWRTLVRRSQKDEPASSGHAMASRSSTMMGPDTPEDDEHRDEEGQQHDDAQEHAHSCLLVEAEHRTDHLAFRHGGEAVVDLRQREPLGDELVELELAFQVEAGEPGEVAPRAGAAVAGAHDALLAHQGAPAEGEGLVHVDLAQEHHRAAGSHRFDREPERRLAPARLDRVVRAAAAGERAHRGHRILSRAVD